MTKRLFDLVHTLAIALKMASQAPADIDPVSKFKALVPRLKDSLSVVIIIFEVCELFFLQGIPYKLYFLFVIILSPTSCDGTLVEFSERQPTSERLPNISLLSK